MTATFGRLQGETLELRDGLNILQAPNEAGKSTWCAFLLSILYGINSRERDRAGFIADKNRFVPWSGAPMSGRIDCSTDLGDLTLSRATRRPSSPMGEFSAVHTGTNEPVPGLTATSCGETLLGVGREVFERSAFIRQNGLSISQDAELERRIAALISSGEEDTSYTEAAEALKKQLNRRRHNKTGLLPALEAERDELERQLEVSESLARQLTQARLETTALKEQKFALQEELEACDRWEAAQRRRVFSSAAETARQAEEHAAQVREQLQKDRVPENESIARLRGAIVNLETTRKALDKARAERDAAMKDLLRAEAAVNESPFAGQTVEQAQREIQSLFSEKVPGPIALRELVIFFLFIAAGIAGSFLLITRDFSFPSPYSLFLPWVPFAGLTAIGGCVSCLYRRHALRAYRNAALLKRFGTADPDAIRQLAETYTKLCETRDAAQASANAKSAAADTLYNTLTANEQGILLEVRRFAPAAFDIPTADRLLRSCAVRRKELAEAEAAAREARMRCEFQVQQIPSPANAEVELDMPAPSRDREAISAELDQVSAALTEAQSRVDRLDGQLRAAGDPSALTAAIHERSDKIDTLQAEYDALSLALEALSLANTTLQNRFSPALSCRAAEIFSSLTENRYTGVVLDRQFHLAAEPAGDSIFRDAALLSAGTLDQLYLAVRLAICDLVLPPKKQVPIVLDDALANFDDDRCAAALRFLKEAAGNRQILLFTCHSREAEFFAEDREVFIQRLTDTGKEV